MTDERQTTLRWVSVYERLPLVDDATVLVANARLGVVLGTGRFTTEAGNLYAGTDNDGEPVWQIYCPYDQEHAVVTLGPAEVTHWLDGALPPVPRAKS